MKIEISASDLDEIRTQFDILPDGLTKDQQEFVDGFVEPAVTEIAKIVCSCALAMLAVLGSGNGP